MSDFQGKNREKAVISFARPDIEVFAREDEGKTLISGYAAKFNTYSEDMGGFRTTIAPGAFDRVLQAGADVRLLVNHDPNLILGRTASGTLKLRADDKGLYFEGEPPDTAMSAHYVASIKRGDMTGCSFSCYIDMDQWDFSGETPIRTVLNLSELLDVGPVSYPAFADTSVMAASRFALEQARAACVIKMLRPSLGLMRIGLELAR